MGLAGRNCPFWTNTVFVSLFSFFPHFLPFFSCHVVFHQFPSFENNEGDVIVKAGANMIWKDKLINKDLPVEFMSRTILFSFKLNLGCLTFA